MNDKNCFCYIVPSFLLIASVAIATWTARVVHYDHSKDTFESPNYLPAIQAVVGLMASVVFISTLIRLVCCSSQGCCGTGLSVISFLVMGGFATVMFVQIGRLNRSERDYYRNDLKNYYELGIGQCCYFMVYFLLVFFQGLSHLSNCCSSLKSNEYEDPFIFV
jgi:hypothetical protein